MPAMTWERQGTWPPRLCPGATAVPHWFSGRPAGGRGSRPGRQTFCAVTAVLVLMLPRHPLDLYGPHRSKVDRTSRVLLHHPQHQPGRNSVSPDPKQASSHRGWEFTPISIYLWLPKHSPPAVISRAVLSCPMRRDWACFVSHRYGCELPPSARTCLPCICRHRIAPQFQWIHSGCVTDGGESTREVLSTFDRCSPHPTKSPVDGGVT